MRNPTETAVATDPITSDRVSSRIDHPGTALDRRISGRRETSGQRIAGGRRVEGVAVREQEKELLLVNEGSAKSPEFMQPVLRGVFDEQNRSDDYVRAFSGLVYNVHDTDMRFGAFAPVAPFRISGEQPQAASFVGPGSIFGAKRQKLLINYNPNSTFSRQNLTPENWESKLTDLFTKWNQGQIYQDYVFDLETPVDKASAERTYGSKPLYADTKAHYNFYIPRYEEKAKDVVEQLLPNMYAFLSEKEGGFLDEDNSIYNQLISLRGQIPGVLCDTETRQSPDQEYQESFGEYFELWTQKIDGISNEDKNYFIRALEFSGFSPEKSYKTNEWEVSHRTFPMAVELEMSTDAVCPITHIVRKTGLGKNLQLFCLGTSQQDLSFYVNVHAVKVLENQETGETSRETGVSDTVYITFPSRDFLEWYNSILLPEPNLMTFWAGQKGEDLLEGQVQYSRALYRMILLGKLKKTVANQLRSYSDLLENRTAYSETLVYHIRKFQGDPNKPIQDFYVANSDEFDVFNFIDTQVKYDSTYTYQVFATEAVIGTEYYYEQGISFEGGKLGTATVHVVFRPVIKILEIPIYTATVTVTDRPPMFPDVSFHPYIDVNDKVLILLNGNTGNLKCPRIPIEPEDSNAMTEFNSDDPVTTFRVYRLEERPTAYTDFANGFKRTISTDFSPETIQSASSAALRDDIVPNRKYYYTFQSVDVHEHTSNPTEIFEVQMLDVNGGLDLLVDVIDLQDKQKPTYPDKFMKRYLYVKPTFLQSIINRTKTLGMNPDTALNVRPATAYDVEKVVLGVEDESVYGRRFKIRLTSQMTGKRIDFNVVFKHKEAKYKGLQVRERMEIAGIVNSQEH